MFRLFSRQQPEASAPVADEVRSLAEPTAFDFAVFGAVPSLAGVNVNPVTAMRVPAVAAGVKALAEAIAILPLPAYRRGEDASRDRDNEHPAYRLLNLDANPWTRGGQLRELMTADAVAYGDAFALIVRDGMGEPRELHRVHPTAVAVEIDRLTGEPRYRVTTEAGQRLIGFMDIIHLRAPATTSMDGVSGVSSLMQARDAIGLLIVLQGHACRLFANGGRPSGILSFPQKLGAEVAKRIRDSWRTATSGSSSGGTAVLEEGGTFTPLAFSSVDNQFTELWQLSLTEVARVLRVPPVLLMDYTRQTWANAETGGQQFLTYSLAPWLARWEAEVTLKLIPAEDGDTIFVEHLTDALLRADFATRATAYGQYRSMGVMTANEVRAGLNLPPIKGGDVLQNPYTTTGKDAGGAADV